MGCPAYQLRISAVVFNQPDFDQEGLQKTLHTKPKPSTVLGAFDFGRSAFSRLCSLDLSSMVLN